MGWCCSRNSPALFDVFIKQCSLCDDSQYGHTYSTYMDQLDVIFVSFSFTEENFSYDKKSSIFFEFFLFFVPLIGFVVIPRGANRSVNKVRRSRFKNSKEEKRR